MFLVSRPHEKKAAEKIRKRRIRRSKIDARGRIGGNGIRLGSVEVRSGLREVRFAVVRGGV